MKKIIIYTICTIVSITVYAQIINNANKISKSILFYGNGTGYDNDIVGGNTISWAAVNDSHDEIKMAIKVIADNGTSVSERHTLTPPLGIEYGSLNIGNANPPIKYYIEGTVSDYVNYGDTPNQWIAFLQYTYERQDN